MSILIQAKRGTNARAPAVAAPSRPKRVRTYPPPPRDDDEAGIDQNALGAVHEALGYVDSSGRDRFRSALASYAPLLGPRGIARVAETAATVDDESAIRTIAELHPDGRKAGLRAVADGLATAVAEAVASKESLPSEAIIAADSMGAPIPRSTWKLVLKEGSRASAALAVLAANRLGGGGGN